MLFNLAFSSVFWGTVSLLLSATSHVEKDANVVKYWEGPCNQTPNPILTHLQENPTSQTQCSAIIVIVLKAPLSEQSVPSEFGHVLPAEVLPVDTIKDETKDADASDLVDVDSAKPFSVFSLVPFPMLKSTAMLIVPHAHSTLVWPFVPFPSINQLSNAGKTQPWLITPISGLFVVPVSVSASTVCATTTPTSAIFVPASNHHLANFHGLQGTDHTPVNVFPSHAYSFVDADKVLTPHCQACTVYDNSIPIKPASPSGSDVLTIAIPTSKPSAPTIATTGCVESVIPSSCTLQDFLSNPPTSEPFVPTFTKSVESAVPVLSTSCAMQDLFTTRNAQSDGPTPTSTVTSTTTALTVVSSQDENVNTFILGEQTDFEQFVANFSSSSTIKDAPSASSPAEIVVRNPIPSGVCEAPVSAAELPECAPFLLGPLKCGSDGTCSTATGVGFVREYVPPSSQLNVSQDSHSYSEEPTFFVYTITLSDVLMVLFLLIVIVSFACFEIANNKLNRSLEIEKAARVSLETQLCHLTENSQQSSELMALLELSNTQLQIEKTEVDQLLEAERASNASLSQRCAHLKTVADLKDANEMRIRGLLTEIERVKRDSRMKEVQIKTLQYENEQQQTVLHSYINDLIVWEENESKALKEKNLEANNRLRDMEKDNAYLKEELTGLQNSIAARKEAEAAKEKAKEQELVQRCEFQFYEVNSDISNYCTTETFRKLSKFKRSFNALADSLYNDRPLSVQEDTPSTPSTTDTSYSWPDYEETLSAPYQDPGYVTPSSSSDSSCYNYDVTHDVTSYNYTGGYSNIPVVSSAVKVTTASIFHSPHLAHMFGREPVAHPSQTISHRENMSATSPLVHSISASSLASSNRADPAELV